MAMEWDVDKPTSYAVAEPDTPNKAGDDEPRTERPAAQLKHEYSHHAEPATTLSADDLAEVIRTGGSTPDAALFQIKVLEWVADGTISTAEGETLMDAFGSEQKVRRLGARAVMMRHGGDDATAAGAAAASEDDDGVRLADEAVAGLTEDDVRCLAAWSASSGARRMAAGGAQAAEQRVLDAQKHPAAAPPADGAEIPPMDRLLWGEPSVYPSAAADAGGKDGAKRAAAKGKRDDGGINELLAIAAAPLAVGAVTILASLVVGRPLR